MSRLTLPVRQHVEYWRLPAAPTWHKASSQHLLGKPRPSSGLIWPFTYSLLFFAAGGGGKYSLVIAGSVNHLERDGVRVSSQSSQFA
jgi:hypothetical protein